MALFPYTVWLTGCLVTCLQTPCKSDDEIPVKGDAYFQVFILQHCNMTHWCASVMVF